MKPSGNPLLTLWEQAPDRLFSLVPKVGRGLLAVLAWILEAFRHLRVGRLLALAVTAALALAAIQIVPPVYGRFALAQEAATAARRSSVQGQDVVLRKLTVAAFKLGFTEVATAPDTFKLEFGQEDGIDMAIVSYDFVHEIDFFGMARLPLRVQDRVAKPPMLKPVTFDPEKSVE